MGLIVVEFEELYAIMVLINSWCVVAIVIICLDNLVVNRVDDIEVFFVFFVVFMVGSTLGFAGKAKDPTTVDKVVIL